MTLNSTPTLLLLVISVSLLVGCERPVADAEAPGPESAATASPATPAASAAPSVSSDATPTKQPEPASPDANASLASKWPAHASLALDPEGLRVFDTRTGSSRLLPYGMAEQETVSALSSILGVGPSEQGDIEICTARFARWKSGLGVWFSEGSFTGWGISEEATGLATISGVKVGSTRAELEARHEVSVFESSLGTEFTAGDLAGVLSSDAPDARITNLWAGNTCIAR